VAADGKKAVSTGFKTGKLMVSNAVIRRAVEALVPHANVAGGLTGAFPERQENTSKTKKKLGVYDEL
jgi:hypothetical protein